MGPTDSPWWEPYIGLPFREGGRDRSGVDCWGLVRLVYADQLLVDLPPLAYQTTRANPGIDAQVDDCRPAWTELDGPREFALALFCMGTGTRYRWHVGIALDGVRMLHATQGADSCVQRLKTYNNQFRGFWWPIQSN